MRDLSGYNLNKSILSNIVGDPFFTILVTAHDPGRKHYLLEALQSALNQDFNIDSYEIILIKDYYDEGIEEFLNKQDKIFTITVNEQYIGQKLKAGLDLARGTYISFLEDDDLFQNNKLSSLYSVIKRENNISLVKHEVSRIDSKGNIVDDIYRKSFSKLVAYDRLLNLSKLTDSYLLYTRIFTNPSTLTCKTSILRANIEYCKNVKLTPDVFIFASHMMRGSNSIFLGSKLGAYRTHNSTSNLSEASIESQLSVVNIYCEDQKLIAEMYRKQGKGSLYRKHLSVLSRFRLWAAMLGYQYNGSLGHLKLGDIGFAIFGEPNLKTFTNGFKFIRQILLSALR